MGHGERVPVLYEAGLPVRAAAVSAAERRRAAARVKRMEQLHESDYYFNRALISTLFAVDWRCRHEGFRAKRGDVYWARAAARSLARWRSQMKRTATVPPEERGLFPDRPSAHQRILWSASACRDESQLLRVVSELQPFMLALSENDS